MCGQRGMCTPRNQPFHAIDQELETGEHAMRLTHRATWLWICFILAANPLFADVVIDWNNIASDVFLSNTHYQNPGMASRSMAMMNLAMYDAINGITPTHQQMYSHPAAPTSASASAAAIQASYRILSSIYPDQQSYLDDQRAASLAAIVSGPAKSGGISYGDLVGTTVINARLSDGFDNMVSYTPSATAGHWEPDPMNPDQQAWGPEWGHIAPFSLDDVSHMMPPPMPDMTSQEYADAFNEVKALGSKDNSSRTPEQTEIALFWAYDRLGMGTPMRMYNGIMRTVAENEGNTLSENARMFAMASTAIADAGIVAWDSKFTYDLWRPISGIRRADEDGNPETEMDPEWVPLGAPGGMDPDGNMINDFTPPFPTYLSGHASFGGAMFESLTNFYETDAVSFDVTSDEVPGAMRSYSSFSQANEENGRSRVYLGIHWNFDDTMAREMGKMTADYVADNYFQPVPEPTMSWLAVLIMLMVSRAAWGRGPRD